MKILVTAVPMVAAKSEFEVYAESLGFNVDWVSTSQSLSKRDLMGILPNYRGWILGDDPCDFEILHQGRSGQLRAIVRWGAGIDNVDLEACGILGVGVRNTPNLFGNEVADVAFAYLILLTRKLHLIDKLVRNGKWSKIQGLSLVGKKAGIVGLGTIGKALRTRLLASGMEVISYDPYQSENFEIIEWPQDIGLLDMIFLTCPLTEATKFIINENILNQVKEGVFIINVARGELIREDALIDALRRNRVQGAALDVFEKEPLPLSSPLLRMDNCILGSHNSSNTKEAVAKASLQSLELLRGLLDGK